MAIVSSPRMMFSATVRTGTSMKCWWTMLMPRAMASDGPVSVTSLPSSRILPSSGRGQPVEDVHERGLAGAVLAEQGVDLAGPDLEVDVVVGDDARIALGDAAHLERGCRDGRDVDGRVSAGVASLVICESSLFSAGTMSGPTGDRSVRS